MRAEGLERKRQHFTTEAAAARPVPGNWDANNPWTCCFTAAAKDTEFWGNNVCRPAVNWVARDARGAPLAPEEAISRMILPGEAASHQIPTTGVGRQGDTSAGRAGSVADDAAATAQRVAAKGAKKAKKAAAKERVRQERAELEAFRNGNQWSKSPKGGQSKGGGKNTGKGKENEVCENYYLGRGACAGEGECPHGRAHRCSNCGRPGHRAKDCRGIAQKRGWWE